MMLFDAPSREICTVKRSRTNTPLQALALLNEVTWVEAARSLAQQTLLHGGTTDAERLVFAFRTATARRPTARELQVLQEGLAADLQRFQADPAAAKQLITHGMSQPSTQLPPESLAAWTLTAATLLNLDEVLVH